MTFAPDCTRTLISDWIRDPQDKRIDITCGTIIQPGNVFFRQLYPVWAKPGRNC
ncbi:MULTISPECIES: hypothetical protein [unclassified Coleofasciculus]|uniref:hypothetical protein n=1 Tax=Cyanophyceae TaxID=3028117 RepID=UPI001688A178|nr:MULTISPECIES: hypothetical protein [unclassified Coleofasciculus]MBD1837937.1 hypothetical protein [Coleofasciculus sp. FACHB-501]MBD1887824.1 hypothetical protein [Coleofasciculus sp. FACHB-SPT9]